MARKLIWKFPLVSMGAWTQGLACSDPGARAPIGASGFFLLLFRKKSPSSPGIPNDLKVSPVTSFWGFCGCGCDSVWREQPYCHVCICCSVFVNVTYLLNLILWKIISVFFSWYIVITIESFEFNKHVSWSAWGDRGRTTTQPGRNKRVVKAGTSVDETPLHIQETSGRIFGLPHSFGRSNR